MNFFEYFSEQKKPHILSTNKTVNNVVEVSNKFIKNLFGSYLRNMIKYNEEVIALNDSLVTKAKCSPIFLKKYDLEQQKQIWKNYLYASSFKELDPIIPNLKGEICLVESEKKTVYDFEFKFRTFYMKGVKLDPILLSFGKFQESITYIVVTFTLKNHNK